MVLLAALAAFGCSDPVSLPTDDPTFEGRIIEKAVDRASVLVQESPEDDCGTWVGIREELESVVILRSSGEEIGFDDLLVGDSIRVWSTFILDSCPGRTGARAAEIIR